MASAPLRRALLAGVAGCLAYASVQLAVNGVVLDETVLPAQIIAGAVRYPDGHPHGVFYVEAYSLGHYASAAWLWLGGAGARESLSAARNVLFLASSLLAAFVVALALTRRAAWAWLAAVLVASEATLRLGGVYPLFVFPHYYSNGHLGLQAAVLGPALLWCGLFASGGVVLGVLPAVHAALGTIGWGGALGLAAVTRGWPPRAARRRLALGVGIGLGVCALLAAAILLRAQDVEPLPAYAAGLDGERVREAFLRLTDSHRHRFSPLRIPLAYLVNPALFAALGALLWRAEHRGEVSTERRTALVGCLLLGALAWAATGGAWLLQQILPVLPGPLATLMPSRFSNVTATLVVPLGAALAARAHARLDPPRRAGVAAAFAVLVVALVAAQWAGRFHWSVASLFALAGFAVGMDAASWPGRGRLGSAAAAALVLGAVAPAAIGGAPGVLAAVPALVAAAALALAGAALGPRLGRLVDGGGPGAPARLAPSARALAAASAALLALAALPDRQGERFQPATTRWDVTTPFDRELAAYLAAQAPGELVLVPMVPSTQIQAKTGAPVLCEAETLWLMTYRPDLAGPVGRLARDLYAIDYADPEALARVARDGQLPLRDDAWRRSWRERSRAHWRRLGARYDFRLVLSRNDDPLDLPVALAGPRFTLYRIP